MNITVLCGGVGGSKLVLGLHDAFPREELTVVVNTGDDLELFGLQISPDIDTVTYTLADLVNQTTGWGIDGDTFNSLAMMKRYSHVGWFLLGDGDLATHLIRTEKLRQGSSLTDVTRFIKDRLGVAETILPVSNDHMSTRVRVADGWLEFQEYFVHRRHADTPLEVEHVGAMTATPTPAVLQALEGADIIVVAPSNPVVSIGPMLAIPGILESLQATTAKIVAVSPFIGSQSITGPADSLMRAIGEEPTSLGLARYYSAWIDRIVIDTADATSANAIRELGVACDVTDTVMRTQEDKRHLAGFVVETTS